MKDRAASLESDYKSSLRPPSPEPQPPRPNPNKKSVLKIVPSGAKRSEAVKDRATRLASDYKSSLRPPRTAPKPQDKTATRSQL